MARVRPQPYLSYDDVLLYPQKGIVAHREDVDLTTRLTKEIYLQSPFVSAPMSSVTEGSMALAMYHYGGFGIIHRFLDVRDQLLEFNKIIDPLAENTLRRAGCAIGINEENERLGALFYGGVRVFCIDIAHAHCLALEKFIEKIPEDIWLQSEWIMGNVATVEGAQFLIDMGADAIKVGIGPGAACTTRNVTGFGVPQLSAIMNIYEAIEDSVPIIADGGIKNSGDAAKALAAGASSVMLGRLLAGADEAPHPGEYFGMASARVNGHKAPEGIEGAVSATGPVAKTLETLDWGVRSAVSYGGGKTLDELRQYAEFVKVSPGTAIETSTRI